MPIPGGIWTMNVVGRYMSTNGCPQKGTVTFTPWPASITSESGGNPLVVTTQPAVATIDPEGWVRCTLINPNDPYLRPGKAHVGVWPYCVTEDFQGGSMLSWQLLVEPSVGNGDTITLGSVTRNCEDILRPADWFPHHLRSTPVKSGRISPR